MSNTKKAQFSTAPLNGDDTIILDGEIIEDSIPAEPTKPLGFIAKHKVWFIAGAAATFGFVAHGFLARPDTCTVEIEDFNIEDIDTSETE